MPLLRDLRLALRALRRSPGFAAASVLTLALAIGAATAVVAVVDRALLRPLPYPDAERLVTLLERDRGDGRRLASYPAFLDYQAQAGDVALGYVRGGTGVLEGSEGPERIAIGYVTPGWFALLGARPVLGRTFAPDEERTDANAAVVLSHEVWRRRFGGDPAVVGRTLVVDGAPLTVIGVMPPGTTYPEWADVWRPIAAVAATDPGLAQRGNHADSRTVARLPQQLSRAQATAALDAVAARLALAHPDDAAGWTGVALTPLRDEVVGDVGPMLLTLAAAVALGLLLAAVNVANLALVRAAGRERELAVRAALGAGRWGVARPILAEAVVIAAAAGAIGALLAAVAVGLLRRAAPPELPRAAELAVDARVLGIAALLSLVVALLCGALPALRAARGSVAGTLRESRGAGPRLQRVQGALTVAQLALAVVLLVGAGLLVQSFRRVQAVDVGFTPQSMLTLQLTLPTPRYDAPEAAAGLYARLVDAAAAVPGVEAAAFVNHPPFGGWIPTPIEVPGRTPDPDGADQALYLTASADYARVLDLPLRRGRWLEPADMTPGAAAVVVNELVAERYWPGQDPIGRPIGLRRRAQDRPGFGEPVHGIVVGVVGSVRHFGLERDAVPAVYVPYPTEPWSHGTLAVRTARPAAAVIPALRRAVLAVEPALPVAGDGPRAGFQPMTRTLAASLAARRWSMGLLTAFAACALLLAALGVYGVTAYAVAQRTRELGVRLALGATPRAVIGLVVRRGAMLALGGVVVGLAGALALSRFVADLLFRTSPTEPVLLALVPLGLVVVATAAAWLPARRAARVDPVVALRDG